MKPYTLDDFINKELKDEEFESLYNKELLINSIAKMVVEMRQNAGLTQKELAERAHTSQPLIARLESGKDKRVPSLELLARLATAANAKINISFNNNK
jgi:predicted transcriptional regulator